MCSTIDNLIERGGYLLYSIHIYRKVNVAHQMGCFFGWLRATGPCEGRPRL